MDVTQIVVNVVTCVAVGAICYAVGWWNRGDHERKKMNLQRIDSILVAT